MRTKQEIFDRKIGLINDTSKPLPFLADRILQGMDEWAKEVGIDILNWVTREESEYSIMYGDQPERFSTFKKDYTSEELFNLYLDSKK